MVSLFTSLNIWLVSLIKLIILLLLITLVIATVTLIERKVLALIQRRVGPNYIGYKGRLQFIADALKLLVKHILVLTRLNKFLFLVVPALVLITSYLFWANLVWGPSLSICEVEYNLFFVGILSATYSLLLVLAGFLSKNKYAMLSSGRALIISLTLEVLLMFFILAYLIVCETLSFSNIVSTQAKFFWHILIFLPVSPIMIITFLVEVGRIPFDLTEAESELVAGYTTEYGGFYFALFYLGEYFHLYCFSTVYVLCLFGGWY